MRAGALLIAGALTSALLTTTAGIATADPASEIPGDGLYLVNVDIKPGTYVSDGTTDEATGCFWRRLWHVQTPTDYNDPNYYVIASDFTKVHPVRIVIKSTDVAFRADNCGAWRMVPDIPTGSFGG
ncbi:hypothetical protein OHB26_20360 [Nocardia sp. NBC_01503]|uniref:hypothetical protein n=1 Tax=Nocardia sp. NBC_01503 TaxID=2975997 RepID=UPI002E7B1C1B|nr:hypothetical protein [Nocardia sp. NBC_01503]WTL29361.1 hypothetical protein OHB26_20360 [Nocardia sp. NBC_01503]